MADRGNNTVWQIDADGGGRPAAGNGQRGFGSDGRPAALAQLSDPRAVAVGADYSIYIADTGNRRVRVVGPDVEFVGIEFTDDGLLVGETPPLVLVDRPHPGRVEVDISFIGESALEGIDGSGLLGVLQLRPGARHGGAAPGINLPGSAALGDGQRRRVGASDRGAIGVGHSGGF